MPLIDPVRIEGLSDVIRSLRQVSADAPKLLGEVAVQAAELVVTRARSDVPRRSGVAARSIRVKPTRGGARVESGGRSAPYFPWLDFGGRVGRRKSVKRPYIADGRYVYPAYRSARRDYERLMSAALLDLVRSAGLSGGG